MLTVPMPPMQSGNAPTQQSIQAGPADFLMAAAEMHSKGEFQSAPVPEGKDLQTGKPSGKRHHIKVVK